MKHKNLSKSATTPPLLLLISAIVLIVSACGGGGGGGGGTPAASTGNNPLPNTGNNPPPNTGNNPPVNIPLTVNRLAPITNLNSFIEKAVVRTINPNNEDILTTSISGVTSPSRRAAHTFGNGDVSDDFAFQNSLNVPVSSVFTTENTLEIGIGLVLDLLEAGEKPIGKSTPSFAVAFPVSGSSTSRNYRGYEISETNLQQTTDNPIALFESLILTTRSEDANDNSDYVTFGVWLIDRDTDTFSSNPNPPPEVGVFGSGGGALTPTSYLHPSTAVTATYTGDAIMMTGRTGRAADSTRTPNSIARGELSLTATFDSAPTVSGEISQIGTIGPNSDTPLPSALTLGSANLQNGDGGFFKGSVVEESQAIGEWGGQFYGDEAGVVSGTFNVNVDVPALTTPELPAGRLSIVGAFGAEKD